MPNKLVTIFLFVFLVITPAFAASPEQPNSVPAEPNASQNYHILTLKEMPEIPKELIDKANKGDPNAQLKLGMEYSVLDSNESFKWLSKSAEQGNFGALSFLSVLGYFYYYGGTQDFNHPLDYNEAFKRLKKAAELGLSEAQVNFGVMYLEGKGVQKDYRIAFEWFTKAAEQGNAQAKNNLGILYYQGFGVQKDYKKAFNWYKQAAEQKEPAPSAFVKLAWMYYKGQGVIEDYIEAYKWALLGGMNGENVDALKQALTAKMTPSQIIEARKLAKEFVETQEKEHNEK